VPNSSPHGFPLYNNVPAILAFPSLGGRQATDVAVGVASTVAVGVGVGVGVGSEPVPPPAQAGPLTSSIPKSNVTAIFVGFILYLPSTLPCNYLEAPAPFPIHTPHPLHARQVKPVTRGGSCPQPSHLEQTTPPLKRFATLPVPLQVGHSFHAQLLKGAYFGPTTCPSPLQFGHAIIIITCLSTTLTAIHSGSPLSTPSICLYALYTPVPRTCQAMRLHLTRHCYPKYPRHCSLLPQ
jgi:hypothetical protein